MKVYTSTGIGIVIGFLIGAAAIGWIPLEKQVQSNYEAMAWWIVVATTVIPMISYAQDEMIFKGALGGFITGLGTGLGFFLLLVGKVC